MDRLDFGAGSDRGSDRFKFFMVWNPDPRRGWRILAYRVHVPKTLAPGDGSFFSFSASHCSPGFRRTEVPEISSSQFRQCRYLIRSAMANFS